MDKAIIMATGPSLTHDAIAWAVAKKRDEGWKLFGVNNVYQMVPVLDEFIACNPEWWDEYHDDPELYSSPMKKWTWDKTTYEKYRYRIENLHHIKGVWADSLSKNPTVLHYGHASGYQVLGIAYNAGIRHFYLLGYDMAYPPNQPRHYFGEYPRSLYHNPRTGPNGEFTGLIEQFETIDEADLGIKVVNLCPTSALNHFEKGHHNDY